MTVSWPQSPRPAERFAGADALKDYCLWEYEPRAETSGKWQGSNLLFQSFAAAGVEQLFLPVCDAIRAAVGVNNTVWGVKYGDGKISWELYFYDYQRLERQVSVSLLKQVLAPFVRCDLNISEQRPYFMFSLDLDASWAQPDAELKEINIYMGNVGSQVSSGLSYSLTDKGLQFDNLYHFFDAEHERQEAIEKLLCSVHVDLPNFPLSQVVPSELQDCGVWVVANKRECDGMYFSRISVDQLLWFMDHCGYPQALSGYVREHRRQLDHLRFDVGLDYHIRDGRAVFHKTAYYGVF